VQRLAENAEVACRLAHGVHGVRRSHPRRRRDDPGGGSASSTRSPPPLQAAAADL